MIESYPYEDYVRQRNWGKACECVESYISIYRCQRARRAWITNFFCFALAVVEAFVTWVLLYPSADEKELAAFPLTTLCHTFYTKLCQNVPGGEVVVIGGLIVIMFLLCLLGILISLTIRPQKPATTTCHTPQTLNGRLKVLKEYYGGLDDSHLKFVIIYFLITVFLTGGIMVFSSPIGGLNPFEYFFVGLIIAIPQAIPFVLFAWLFNVIYPDGPIQPFFDWSRDLDKIISDYTPTRSSYVHVSDGVRNTDFYKEQYDKYYAEYTGTSYESPEDKAKRIALEIEDDLSGKGYGDY